MAGPTLLQTLLNRPTKRYSSPSSGDSGRERHASDPHEDNDIRAVRGSRAYPKPSALRVLPPTPPIPLPLLVSPPPTASGQARLSSEPAFDLLPPSPPFALAHHCQSASDDSSGSDAFYTPTSSPAGSPGARTPVDLRPTVIISSEADETSFVPSSASSAVSEDAVSNFSWALSHSSRTSESTHNLAARSPRAKSGSQMATQVLAPPPVSFPRQSPDRSSQPDWAKDSRWLATSPSQVPTRAPRASPSRTRQYSARPRTAERMSALVEEDGEEATEFGEGGLARSRTLSAPSRSSFASSLRAPKTVEVPTTPATSSGVTSANGYTSLVLPLAAYTPAKNPAQSLASNKADLPRSGIAQTTMSTISITKNGASQTKASRRLSLHGLFSSSPSVNSFTPDHLRAAASSPLSFTSLMQPPSKFGSSQLIVQVWAVALDRLDALIVNDKANKSDGSGYGFIPGRGFVGRVVESGVEVSDFSRGDWVFGSLDVKKSGALAEFVVVDRRRIHHIPQVFQPPPRPVQSRRRSRVVSSPPTPPPLTLEQIAFLALAGISAHRAVQGLSMAIAAAKYDTPKRPVRALVLQGHDGVGFLATQQLAAQKVHIVAQVPRQAEGSSFDHVAVARAAGAAHVLVGEPDDILDDLRDMIVGKLSWSDDGPGLDEFDCIVDTVGGKSIWNQARVVMREGGHFVTTVGDERNGAEAAFTAGAHFRHNIRAMKRAFTSTSSLSPSANVSGSRTPFSSRSADSSRRNSESGTGEASSPSYSMFSSLSKGDSLADVSHVLSDGSSTKKARLKVKKQISYQWVSAASDVDTDGQDIRDSLIEVAKLAQAGTLMPSLLSGWPGSSSRPRSIQLGRRGASEGSPLSLPVNVASDDKTGKVFPFERTPEVLQLSYGFNQSSAPVDLDSGGIAIIRLVG